MNCQEFQSIVRDYSRGEWTNPSQQSDARLHLMACAACRLRLDTESALNAAFTWTRTEADAPPRVEQAVLAAFRQRKPAAGAGWRKASWVAIGLAAGLLLAALALTPRDPKPEPVVAEVSAPTPSPKVEPVAPEPLPVTRPTPAARAPRITYANSKSTDGRLSEFIPLRYGKPLESGEPVQVIRIALPRTELVRMGLPVAMDGGATTVKADVLLGEDGLAKAIRFVY